MWQTGAYGYPLDYLLWLLLTGSMVLHAVCVIRFWPRDRHPRCRLAIGNLAIGIALLAVTAFAAETYLRFVSTTTDALGATLTCKRWRLAYMTLNSLYCRDVEWTEKKPRGVYRIAFLGDSFTLGWGINDPQDRFTDLLQKRFEQTGRQVEVMNVAWAGWDTAQQLEMLREHFDKYELDEVVIDFVPNDIERFIAAATGEEPLVVPRSHYVNTDSSFLLDWTFHRIVAPRMLAGTNYLEQLAAGYAHPAVEEQQMETLAQLAEWCRDREIRLRVVLLPFLLTGPTDVYNGRTIHAKVAGWFEQVGAEVVDLIAIAEQSDPSELILGYHDPHPNETAHRLFADAIWNAFYQPLTTFTRER